ncbi:50S ribosomal protein L31e [Nanoarchaeota archaeon]
MAPKTKTTKQEKLEREYVIPLRAKRKVVPRYKKTPKSIKTVKEFLVRHMKIYDKDLNKIKLDKYLNEYLWARGIKNPPHKVKVKAIKEGEFVRVELVDYPDKLKFKKIREDKLEKASKEAVEKKKTLMEKAKEAKETKKEAPLGVSSGSELGGKKLEDKVEDKDKDGVKDKKEEQEKKASVVEAGQEQIKAQAKAEKHMKGGKTKQPKRPVRVAMNK